MESPQPGGASGSQTVTRSQTRVKQENDGDSTAGHLHEFYMKLDTGNTKYSITCNEPRTVLEAMKSHRRYKETFSDGNLVIDLGTARDSVLATHFPCTCISEGEILTLTCESEEVEKVQDQRDKPIQSSDKYSVFYIDTEGGLFTKQKKLFRNNALKKFKYLCVYGEKGMTVKEVLERDGRFIDFGDFELTDNKDPEINIECKQLIDNLHGKKFKIRLPRKANSMCTYHE